MLVYRTIPYGALAAGATPPSIPGPIFQIRAVVLGLPFQLVGAVASLALVPMRDGLSRDSEAMVCLPGDRKVWRLAQKADAVRLEVFAPQAPAVAGIAGVAEVVYATEPGDEIGPDVTRAYGHLYDSMPVGLAAADTGILDLSRVPNLLVYASTTDAATRALTLILRDRVGNALATKALGNVPAGGDAGFALGPGSVAPTIFGLNGALGAPLSPFIEVQLAAGTVNGRLILLG